MDFGERRGQMNSSLIKNHFILNQKKRNQFCSSLLGDWEVLALPTEKDESYRKFPISSIDWNELGFDPKVKNDHYEGQTDDSANPLVSEDTLDVILNLVKHHLPKDYFTYVSVLFAREIQIVVCEDGTNDVYRSLLGDDARSLVRIFYVPRGYTSQIKLYTETKHDTERLHLQTIFDVFVSEGDSHVEILDEENCDEDLIQFRSVLVLTKENASVKLHHFPFGGFRSKLFLHSHLLGKGAEVTIDGVSALSKRNLKDLDMEMIHHADHTTSKISYKTIVTDRSHHIFTGNLIIPPNLKKVVAHQESFNLSLNKKARAEANPKLEVLAEDVSCTHGATVGDIDEEQYFYLLSRGLSPEESKSLLVTAFYGETIQRIGFSDQIKEGLESTIHGLLVGGK